MNELKGQVVKLAATSANFLNPMDIIFDRELINEEDPIPDKIDFVISLMELICGDLTPSERSMVDRAAKKIYINFLEKNPSADKMPILGDLQDELQRYGEITENVVTSLERQELPPGTLQVRRTFLTTARTWTSTTALSALTLRIWGLR